MPAPEAILSYGSAALQLGETPRIVRRGDGFDEGAFAFIGGSENSLLPNSEVPGYNGMYIQEDSITDHSGDLEHSVRAVGLRSGTSRLIASIATDSEDGFDTGSETFISAEGATASYVRGRRHSQYSQLYAVSVSVRRSPITAYAIVDVGYKGIKNGNRPDKIKLSVASRETTYTALDNPPPGGTPTETKWSVMKGDPMLVRSYISQYRPDFSRVGLQNSASGVPVSFPAVPNHGWSNNDDVTWNMPFGWFLANIESDEIAGTTLNFVTETYLNRDRFSL